MKIAVLGAGAFGTALAITLSRGGAPIGLWSRDAAQAHVMNETRKNDKRLPGGDLPASLMVSADIVAFSAADIFLLAMPMQKLGEFLARHAKILDGRALVACAKGIDLASGLGPSAIIAKACPESVVAVLTGPSFATDIAKGLPTALALATADDADGGRLQTALATPTLRLYRTTDIIGAELGGALKNVIAIAAGVVIGAGLGDSARAAVMTRGFAEMSRLGQKMGATPETLAGLSGLGDLVLTCTSAQSRNFGFGHAMGAGASFDQATTVEGVATAKAVSILAKNRRLEMPIAEMVAALCAGDLNVSDAITALLSRPLRKE
jgi:glycerol-3-phosphate dehydrogenase (NAD(P)+)